MQRLICVIVLNVCVHCVCIYVKVESSLLEKLCEQIGSVLAALKRCDPQCTGYVKQEDLKRVLIHHGAPISDTHFNK